MRIYMPKDPRPEPPGSKRWRPFIWHLTPPLAPISRRPARWWGWEILREFYLELGIKLFLLSPLILVALLVWWLS